MTHPIHAADELPDEAVMQLVDRLFDRWQLDEQTRRRLLSIGQDSSVAGNGGSSAALVRARQLLTIHAGLRCLFPDDPELRWNWVTMRNKSLDGSTPLAVMVSEHHGTSRILQLVWREVAT